MQDGRAWVSGVIVAVGLAVSCGGTTVSNTGEKDGGAGRDAQGGSSACAALAACCKSPAVKDPTACASTALSGALSSAACAMELQVYQANGLCFADAGHGDASRPSDATVPPAPDAANPPGDAVVPPPADAFSEGMAPPVTTCAPSCHSPQVCIALPGVNATCGSACTADKDCPALMTCGAGGVCTDTCASCPAGQQCADLGNPGFNCTSNGDCQIGAYCDTSFPGPGGGGMCQPYQACTACIGECPKCMSNGQCQAGQACINQACVACSSNSQCGSSATAACTATHSGMQCTCTADGDCQSGQTCQNGVCSTAPDQGCDTGFPGSQCENGKACINNVCGACMAFADCNQSMLGNPRPPMGLACINGACAACTANSQCGGGMACVGGTCGTCSTNAQCGTTGACSNGFCTCTATSQCAAGQSCGAGVCVAM